MLYGRALDGGAFGCALEARGLARGHAASHAPKVGFRAVEVGAELLNAVEILVDSIKKPGRSKRRIVFIGKKTLHALKFHPGIAAAHDEAKAFKVRRAVLPLSSRTPPGFLKNPARLVEADRSHRRPGAGGQFSDFHG